MGEDHASERRRYPRVPTEHALLARKLGVEACEEFSKTSTVGQGGCSFLSRESFGVGALIEVVITIYGDVVQATAKVVYERKNESGRYEIGMEFLELTDDDQPKIARLLS